MKWIKKYETFTNDNNRDSSSIDYLPKFNPAIKQEATEFVESLLKSDYDKLFKLVGMEMPEVGSSEMDELFDEVREKAIEYYVNNPEAIGKEIELKSFKVNGGDGASRTNNIGGTSFANSIRIGESKSESDFDTTISITDDEMNLFNIPGSLQDLISNGKISLRNKEVHFNKEDEETLDTLDSFLEIDKSQL